MLPKLCILFLTLLLSCGEITSPLLQRLNNQKKVLVQPLSWEIVICHNLNTHAWMPPRGLKPGPLYTDRRALSIMLKSRDEIMTLSLKIISILVWIPCIIIYIVCTPKPSNLVSSSSPTFPGTPTFTKKPNNTHNLTPLYMGDQKRYSCYHVYRSQNK